MVKLGIGTSTPSEVLALTGPLVVGGSKATGATSEPGSIKYDGGRFSIRLHGSQLHQVNYPSDYFINQISIWPMGQPLFMPRIPYWLVIP